MSTDNHDPEFEAATADADTPTLAQAREMFKERPDLAAVLTNDGTLHRDGTLVA